MYTDGFYCLSNQTPILTFIGAKGFLGDQKDSTLSTLEIHN